MILEVNNKIIDEPIINILKQLKNECSWDVFDKIEDKGSYLRCTCPFHKDGHESRPSFSVYSDYNGDIVPGTYHCFTCNEKGQLYQLVSYCLNISNEEAKMWLEDRFGNVSSFDKLNIDDDIVLDKKENKCCLDEGILKEYSYFHPYMFKRKLKENIIRKFKVGYDKVTNSLTFPIWDEYNSLVGITKRNVENKRFEIPANINKPVYLFNEIKKNDYPFVVVCEAQIDALTSWGYGVPAVAMLGVGSDEQYKTLNKIHTNWVTMFDNDYAGRSATKRFNENIRKDCMVVNIEIPKGKKDINDLDENEFDDLLRSYGLSWRLSDE